MSAPPDEVFAAFLGRLNRTVREFEAELVPVVRGSALLRHWLGDAARPAADIDLECFSARGTPVPAGERFGGYEEYESLVDFGKAMCRYAANSSRYGDNEEDETAVEFEEADPPAGGVSLWTYGTPGERYFAGWQMPATGEAGLLQLDIAESNYTLDDIATTTIEVALDGESVECPAYAPETMLAAKLSWLLRSFERANGTDPLTWKGEPKDLFDAHLLLTQVELEAEPFQKSFLAIGTQDGLNWNALAEFMTAGHALKDKDFHNWPAFRKAHKDIIDCGPAEMLRAIAENLQPLLGEFYPADEMPFILSANANTADEMPLLVHADWLNDHDRPALAAFVRAYAKYEFHFSELTPEQQAETRAALKAGFDAAPRPWLLQFFGHASAADDLRAALARPAA